MPASRGRRHQPALRLDDRQAHRLGRDRAQALARLDAALRDTHIVGLHTNVAFLRRVVGSAPLPPPTSTPR
jgi:hypothetical protein